MPKQSTIFCTYKLFLNDPKRYLSFCKFGSGVTDESLSAISDRLSAHWNDIQRTRPPAWLCFEEEQPELWIDPAKCASF